MAPKFWLELDVPKPPELAELDPAPKLKAGVPPPTLALAGAGAGVEPPNVKLGATLPLALCKGAGVVAAAPNVKLGPLLCLGAATVGVGAAAPKEKAAAGTVSLFFSSGLGAELEPNVNAGAGVLSDTAVEVAFVAPPKVKLGVASV